MIIAFIPTREGPWLRVHYKGYPPCLLCGKLVYMPSADGPLVCPLCDMGIVPESHGGFRQWTWEERKGRIQHLQQRIEEIATSQTDEDKVAGYIAAGRFMKQPPLGEA